MKQLPILELPNEDVEFFDLFVEWLLSGAVPVVPLRLESYHISYKKVEQVGMIEYEKSWYQLALMVHKFCCTDLEKVFEVLETYHSPAGIVCHPSLLDQDFVHMPDSAALETFVMVQLKALEDESLEDFSSIVNFLVAKAPQVLGKAALAEQLKRFESREDGWAGWISAKKKKRKKSGDEW